eukprot:361970-Chlamydomonas_euryale.AAC.6
MRAADEYLSHARMGTADEFLSHAMPLPLLVWLLPSLNAPLYTSARPFTRLVHMPVHTCRRGAALSLRLLFIRAVGRHVRLKKAFQALLLLFLNEEGLLGALPAA